MNPVPRALYVHVPFCRRRCFYCDFPIAVLGEWQPVRGNRPDGQPDPTAPRQAIDGGSSGRVRAYVADLLQDIAQTHAQFPSRSLTTVFLGGGTPSLLSVEQLAAILEAIDRTFGLEKGAEISIEMDPGTFDRPKLAGFLAAGVKRVSLGVQAFQDELLAVCGRSHRVAEITKAIATIQDLAVENWSLDLISGLPHQTAAQWQESLHRAIAAAPTHLSVYDLIVEPKTAFAHRYHPGVAPLPSDRQAADFYRQAAQTLRAAGYQHYEISNYARPGYACRHNQVYWHNLPYWGLGSGATGYVDGARRARPRRLADYGEWVARGGKEAELAAATEPAETRTDRLLDTLMLGLRLAEGIGRDRLHEEFGPEFAAAAWAAIVETVQPMVDRGWVSLQTEPEARLALRDPEGFLLSNQVLSSLFNRLTRL